MSQPNSQPTSGTNSPLPGESTSKAFDTKQELFKMFGKKTFKKGMEFKNSQQVSRLSKSEVESLEKHFMSIDKNSDRLINKKEFSTALGMMPNDTYLSNAIFEAIDTNKNGEISFEEYMDTMAVLLHGTPDERLVIAFTFFDVENDFQVTHQEVEKMLIGVFKILSGLNIPSFEETDAILYAAELFELLDVHKVGVIKFEEFKEIMPKISNKIIGLGRLKSNTTQTNLISPGDTVLWGSKSWNAAFEMMIGMRLAWEMTSEFKRPLRNEDFTIEVKFKLPKFQHESATFVDYAPHAFSNIRKKFNISNDFYMLSLGPEQVLGNLLMGNMSTLSEKVSDGKSGSFFFFSHDSRFLVKTIPTKEAITFSSILPSYYNHLMENPDSLICRIYGSHEISGNNFIVMGNVLESPLPLSSIFDLKGSTVGRTNPNGFVKKDLDLKKKINIGQNAKEKLMKIMEKDVEFLKSNNLIDYSLIVGIYETVDGKLPKEFEDLSDFRHGKIIPSFNENGVVDCIFFFGIIDMFTAFDNMKKAENLGKSILGMDSKKISAVPSSPYAERFLKFMESVIE